MGHASCLKTDLRFIFVRQSKITASKIIIFKALLVHDNAPGHATALNGICEDMKVVFLPPNAMRISLLQLMDHGNNFNFQGQFSLKHF
jgi:hypothetical protein